MKAAKALRWAGFCFVLAVWLSLAARDAPEEAATYMRFGGFLSLTGVVCCAAAWAIWGDNEADDG